MERLREVTPINHPKNRSYVAKLGTSLRGEVIIYPLDKRNRFKVYLQTKTPEGIYLNPF